MNRQQKRGRGRGSTGRVALRTWEEPIVISRAGSCPADDAICEGISPLGYWQKVNPSPTQTKPYNTLPPFEPRGSWSSYGAVRAYSEVLYILWGPRESDLSGS